MFLKRVVAVVEGADQGRREAFAGG